MQFHHGVISMHKRMTLIHLITLTCLFSGCYSKSDFNFYRKILLPDDNLSAIYPIYCCAKNENGSWECVLEKNSGGWAWGQDSSELITYPKLSLNDAFDIVRDIGSGKDINATVSLFPTLYSIVTNVEQLSFQESNKEEYNYLVDYFKLDLPKYN